MFLNEAAEAGKGGTPLGVILGFVLGFVAIALTVLTPGNKRVRVVVAMAAYAGAIELLLWTLLPVRLFPIATSYVVLGALFVSALLVMRKRNRETEAMPSTESMLLRLVQLSPRKLDGMRRHWILRYRIHNDDVTDMYSAKMNFVVDGDSTGSPPWYSGWGTHAEPSVRIAKGDYEDLNIAVVVEPGSVRERWQVHGVKPPYESIGYREDPVLREIGFSILITRDTGAGQYRLGVRIMIKDQTPRAERDDSILSSPAAQSIVPAEAERDKKRAITLGRLAQGLFPRATATGYARESLANWSESYEQRPAGVLCKVHSKDGDRRRLQECRVTAPDGTVGFAKPDHSEDARPHFQFEYPSDFDGVAEETLGAGEYRIEWSGVGGQLIRIHTFAVEDGRLKL